MNEGVIGGSFPRQEAVDKVTGQAKYTGDLNIPGMCHARVLRSPVPHARIGAIDVSKAEQLPGVIAVLTGQDLDDVDPYFGSIVRDRPIIAIDRVRYIGEPVVAVAAEDPESAEEATQLIEVDYQELPGVFDLEAALDKGAPILHEHESDLGKLRDLPSIEHPKNSNICSKKTLSYGDVEKGFSDADLVVEDTFTFPAVYHYAMEPYVCIAQVDTEIVVWASAQHPFVVRADLANMFAYPLNRVRIVIPFVGGGFGSKSYTKIEPLTVALARKAQRPVKLAFSVEEAMYTNRRHGARVTIRTGVKKDGTLTARQGRIDLDTGAYADNGPRVAVKAANSVVGPYYCPNILAESCAVYTNTTPAGSFRAIGSPQVIWAIESQMDRIAEELGIDAAELRDRNLFKKGSIWLPGTKGIDADLGPSLKKLQKAIQWEKSGQASQDGKLIGRGLGCALRDAGASPVSTALVRLHVDGTVTVLSSTTEIGQGSKTVLGQIVSQELKLSPERVRVLGPDTDLTPFDRSTGASRSTVLMGTAVAEAAKDLAEQLAAAASDMLGVPQDSLNFVDGEVHAADRIETYAGVIQHLFGISGGELIGRGYVAKHWGDRRFAQGPVFYEVGMSGVVVRVEPETGMIFLEQLASVADVGKAINKNLVEGQDEGAAMMGIGHSCFEEMKWDAGQLLNSNLVDYRVPTFDEIPGRFETIFVENADGPGPYGAKGMGEGGLLALAPAVGNALRRAIGVRIFDLPFTPERVWKAIQSRPAGPAPGTT